jgi:hypothetical protein
MKHMANAVHPPIKLFQFPRMFGIPNLSPFCCKLETAWEHGGADFQSRFDTSTAQAEEMKEGALRVL